jgi:hypothetical protein
MRNYLAILAMSAAAVAWPAGVARAERLIYTESDGSRCEQTHEGDLGKIVCRHPSAPQTRWSVCFFQHHPYVTSPLTNCFAWGGVVTRNDAPDVYLSNIYPGRRAFSADDGMTCYAMVEASLMKHHCWNPYAQHTDWVVCMYERANGVIFGDCISSGGRQWSRQLPPHLWP